MGDLTKNFSISEFAQRDPYRPVPQQWIVTTTAKDTVYKLRARKDSSLAAVTIKAIQIHTTIRAIYIGRASA